MGEQPADGIEAQHTLRLRLRLRRRDDTPKADAIRRRDPVLLGPDTVGFFAAVHRADRLAGCGEGRVVEPHFEVGDILG